MSLEYNLVTLWLVRYFAKMYRIWFLKNYLVHSNLTYYLQNYIKYN